MGGRVILGVAEAKRVENVHRPAFHLYPTHSPQCSGDRANTFFFLVAKKNRLCGDVSFVRDNWYFCDKIDKDKINNFLIDSKILPVAKRFFVVG